MGRLIVSAQTTVDLVMDPMDDWFDPAVEEGDNVAQLRGAEALLLGRKTYEGLAEYWPKADDAYAELINPMPKYVASRTLSEPLKWNSQLLGADLADEVAALKGRLSGDLVLYGCGELAGSLSQHGLVDEVRFWLHPYIWGQGVRPFEAGGLPVKLRLLSATPYASGFVQLKYQPVAG
jgi:dihydrofolate reductase